MTPQQYRLSSSAEQETEVARRMLFEQGRESGLIYIHPGENSAVQIAADNLAQDIEKACGVRPEVTHEWRGNVIIAAGTLAHLPMPGDIRTDTLWDEYGELRWDGYLQQIHCNVLYLVGCDRRGAIYAIYDFLRAHGRTPLV